MKPLGKIVFAVVVLSAAACSIKPITQESIRATPEYKLSFSVDRPYQQVFADLLDNTRSCFSRVVTQEQLYVAGKKDIGAKTANIIVEHLYAKLEHNVHFMIDLKSESTNKTAVVAYISDSGEEAKVNAVKAWANNSNKECEV